ncbi:glycosyltransferase [Trichococcus sp. K1Tr]|uniref:glycosyltransferase n=1 Tax=Trichococcus sp. K1Tr TaxID=3020847 RepID=UPI00232D2EEC|nr:glycosyltransferase [Trichococcus sp. K1Tr]MDB6353565.1 glycosyltransferase [Trichococcus sp. K1Tr]
MYKYAGVVVLYNPDIDVEANINTYINEIDKLYIIDNSEHEQKAIIQNIINNEKSIYVNLDGNKGLGYALNVGCRMAVEDGFNYVLTMDQDSKFENNGVKTIVDFIEKSHEHYSIVCPNVKSVYSEYETNQEKVAYTLIGENLNEIRNWVMTSGSMMFLEDYMGVNGFDDEMFIAHLDIDLGIKLYLNNKKIIMLGNSVIIQRFGNSIPKKILWKTVHPSFAAPVRTYYLFRNQKYLERKYGKGMKKIINVHLYKFIIKIMIFEDRKIEKMKMAIRGIIDAKKKKMGAYS